MQKQRELVRSRMLLLKSHFKERKTGTYVCRAAEVPLNRAHAGYVS